MKKLNRLKKELEKRMSLFTDPDDLLYKRGLYDGYKNTLDFIKIIKTEKNNGRVSTD
jgi:hypothetical protein